MRIIACGLNGAGKSTLGRALAGKLHYEFRDIEDYYFPMFLKKTHNGTGTRFAIGLLLVLMGWELLIIKFHLLILIKYLVTMRIDMMPKQRKLLLVLKIGVQY